MHHQKPPLGTQLDWSNPLNKGCVLHLAMNEGHGDKVQDLSMYGNHGTMHNFAYPPTVASGWNPGRNGIGLTFDGVNDVINCGHDSSLDITDEITIEVGFKATSIQAYLLAKNSTSADDNQYAVFVTGIAGVDRATYYPTEACHSAIGSLIIGEWQHITLTRNGSGIGQFYIDGHASGTPVAISMPSKPTFDLVIGRRNPNDWYVGGSIDQVRILNRAYTAQEVLDYYNNPYQVYLDEDD